jgi:hypothetical protein
MAKRTRSGQEAGSSEYGPTHRAVSSVAATDEGYSMDDLTEIVRALHFRIKTLDW